MHLGCTGGKVAKTPNIDALAKSATWFPHSFASVASCSPPTGLTAKSWLPILEEAKPKDWDVV